MLLGGSTGLSLPPVPPFCLGVVGVIHQLPPSMFVKFFVPRLGHVVGWHDPVIVRGILESLLSSADASCICCGMVHRV